MLKQITVLSLLFSTTVSSVNLVATQPATASKGCINNCNTDSLLYICIKNTTQKPVYIKGQNAKTNFFINAKPNGQYWYWFRRARNENRDLTVFLNGKKDNAHYKWTGLTPAQLGADQACFFNKWEIKENRNGRLYLRNAS